MVAVSSKNAKKMVKMPWNDEQHGSLLLAMPRHCAKVLCAGDVMQEPACRRAMRAARKKKLPSARFELTISSLLVRCLTNLAIKAWGTNLPGVSRTPDLKITRSYSLAP